jgi:hypothetical protein
MSVISEKVPAISKPYFGPATESFLARQCKGHLSIDMGDLAQSHLKDLAKWVESSGALIMDPGKAAEVAKKIACLSHDLIGAMGRSLSRRVSSLRQFANRVIKTSDITSVCREF